jgi:hypothetical protein
VDSLVKVKVLESAEEGCRGIALHSLDVDTLEGGRVVSTTPWTTLPPVKTRYPLYRRGGGPQGRSGRVQEISLPLGFDPWTVQPVASRYTD